MENLPWFLGVLAAILHAVGYIAYNIQSKRKESKPNAVSWFIWALMAGLNVTSFAQITSIPHALQYIVGTFASVTTFALAFWWGRFDWPTSRETAALVLCLFSVSMWYYLKSASIGNAIALLTALIALHPTYKGVLEDPLKERARAWSIWTLACTVSLLNNVISWNGKWMSVINPAILLLCHASIAYLSREARRRRVVVT